MISTFKPFAAALGLAALGAPAAQADGIDPVYQTDGRYLGDVEIIGDVTLPSGETYAVLELRAEHMRFYVDPDAIYVMMDRSNPIIAQRTPFGGFWLATPSADPAYWPACGTAALDEYGTAHPAHGTVVWTNTGIADNGYELGFTIDIGACGDPPSEFAVSRAVLADYVPATPPPGGYTITDANGDAYTVDIGADGTTLVSVLKHDIVESDLFYGHEVLAMYPDCTTSSWRRGFGSWSWANGGFVIDFDNVSFSFPRMDAPVDNGGACRM